LPEKARGPAFTRLVEDVAEEHDHHLTTGIFGVKYVLDLLPSRGRPDVAARVVNARSFPSFGYMLDNGATTLWEAWRKDERVGSHNHPMFGSVHEYLMKHVAGIAPAEDAVGMDRLVLRPQPTAEVTWARGSYRSVRGAIVSDWRLRDGAFVWDVVVPVGAAAVAHVPIGRDGVVTEAGRPAREAPGIRARAPHADAPPGPRALVLELASGSYRFTSHPDR
jgi:alpha-L-rhamnosidase